ncbi:hypothetical protein CMI47_18700 [Candidatus Pacearchaeota archaeon]|nr:hypothetical protein [Candidatus Pacearchaeota archaeon]|tara:strand:+ start:516 stop:758 length:243 start_codon:yes stop_codon:yes gene_type:complete
MDDLYRKIENSNIRTTLTLVTTICLGLFIVGREIEKIQPEIQERNVIGGPEAERFYDTSAGRVYLEVDGKPVGEYFPREE